MGKTWLAARSMKSLDRADRNLRQQVNFQRRMEEQAFVRPHRLTAWTDLLEMLASDFHAACFTRQSRYGTIWDSTKPPPCAPHASLTRLLQVRKGQQGEA
jgi:hypothetical protein